MTETGVSSLEVILAIMSLHDPRVFVDRADRTGVFRHMSTREMMSLCGKPFIEVTLRRE
jgi:hypothetical protein